MKNFPQIQEPIAIVGLAGRFPGAPNPDALWKLLCEGREGIVYLSDEECRAAGVDEETLANPNYVKACMPTSDVEYFDAEFFGYTPNQAIAIDPQARIFLQSCWHAMENAGYDTQQYQGTIGVFASVGENQYFMRNMDRLLELNSRDLLTTLVGSSSDFLTTRVSYKLGLSGPSMTVRTACSASLVAVHLGCQSLLNRECDIALCGGVAIKPPPYCGDFYREGGIKSPDGHCRAYDAQGKGSIGGQGAGVVVLKRLSDAIADSDTIVAVIRGSAMNNDGSQRLGFSAPSVNGQVALLRRALAVAGLRPEDIGYVEGHGTATVLGDAVELTALSEVFGQNASCLIGSIKSNIGHLDAAAGIAGLIKVALCLKHKAFVPSLHFTQPHPILETQQSLIVNTEYKDWVSPEHTLRRAGVSSFGLGGTNAHVVLEEYKAAPQAPIKETPQLLPLSAQTPSALATLAGNLGMALADPQFQPTLADVAHTLKVGRRALQYRHYVVAESLREATNELNRPLTPNAMMATGGSDRSVVFLCPGDGGFATGAAQHLYASNAAFRQHFDACAAVVRNELGVDLRQWATEPSAEPMAVLNDVRIGHPMQFALVESIGRVLMECGVTPHKIVGHGLGEFAAASLAGILSFEDALRVVCRRASLVREMLSGAPINSAVQSLLEVAGQLPHHAPKLSFVSSLTGEIITPHQSITPEYWGRHLVSQPNFSTAVKTVTGQYGAIVVGLGQGKTLLQAFHQPGNAELITTISAVPEAARITERSLLDVVGRIWQEGGQIHWPHTYATSSPRRVPLPGYPFERKKHWIDSKQNGFKAGALSKGQALPLASDSTKKTAMPVNEAGLMPRTELEKTLASIWGKVLGLETIGVNDDFFHLGGDSLVALQVLARVQDAFGVEIAPRQFLGNATTIAALSVAVVAALAHKKQTFG